MISFCATELAKKEDKKVSVEIDETIELFDDIKSSGNTKGTAHFQLRSNFIIITGDFKSPIKVSCDRCTKDYELNLEFKIDEVVEVSDEPYPSGDVEFVSDEINEQIRSDEQIGLEDYIRQYIILNVPTKKICSENCVNEELNDFNAKSGGIDPRWEQLIKYKDKIKGE